MTIKRIAILMFSLFLLASTVACNGSETDTKITSETAAIVEESTVIPETEPVSGDQREFRVVGYVLGNMESAERMATFDIGHLDHLTDVILFDVWDMYFNKEGIVTVTQYGRQSIRQIKSLIGDRPIRLHVFMTGPEDMTHGAVDKGYQSAFQSGVLEENIKNFLETFELDGVHFDWEFPDTEQDYANFSDFIVSLDKVLGDEYYISCSLNMYHSDYSEECIHALDMVQVMAYDVFDNQQAHSTLKLAERQIKTLLHRGYSPEQLDLALPFYGRPGDDRAAFYDYSAVYDQIGEDSWYVDSQTGKRAYMNDPAVVYEKTMFAIENNLGGVAAWHYDSDAPSDSGHSLFSAIQRAKDDAGIE